MTKGEGFRMGDSFGSLKYVVGGKKKAPVKQDLVLIA